MLVSYMQKGKQIDFCNTYSNYNSAVNGFSREVKRIAKERGVDPLDIAGKEMFLTSLDFICSCQKVNKKCNSIREMEKWLTNYIRYLEEIRVVTQSNELDEMDLKILFVSQPMFFGQAQTDSKFLYDMFKKKTKNWLVELV